MSNEGFTLRSIVNKSKKWYEEKYGALDWHWKDEGFPYAVLDYHASKGSTLDFSVDDWAVISENGWNEQEIAWLCWDE